MSGKKNSGASKPKKVVQKQKKQVKKAGGKSSSNGIAVARQPPDRRERTNKVTVGGLVGQGVDMFGKWLGFGSYKLNKNTIADRSAGTAAPIAAMHGNEQDIVVRHKEYLCDIVSSGSANTFLVNNSFALNPGLINSFPWLSGIAQNFQEYEFLGLAFEYKSTSADAIASSTNTALGTVMISTQYRSTLAAPSNKITMLQEEYANDCKPADSMVHFVECDPRQNPYNVQYIRASAVPSGEDQKTYDLGTTFIATTGFQGTSVVCGEIWVSYEVVLRKPILNAGVLGSEIYTAHYYNPSGATNAAPMGSGTQVKQYDNIGITVSSAGLVTIPLGSMLPSTAFFLIFSWDGATASAFTGPTLTNCSALNVFKGSTVQYVQGIGTANGTGQSIGYMCICSGGGVANVTFQLNCTTLTGAGKAECMLIQVPSNIA